jgi:hypothetical protein
MGNLLIRRSQSALNTQAINRVTIPTNVISVNNRLRYITSPLETYETQIECRISPNILSMEETVARLLLPDLTPSTSTYKVATWVELYFVGREGNLPVDVGR